MAKIIYWYEYWSKKKKGKMILKKISLSWWKMPLLEKLWKIWEKIELGKILMYDFCYDYVKPKYSEKAIVYIIYIKIYHIYRDIAEGVETRFEISNYELDRPLLKIKNKKVIGLMKDELGGKIMAKFVELWAKTYSYLIDDGSEDKKGKTTIKCIIKRKLKFENYKSCLEATQLDNEIKYLEKIKLT